ncbi:dual oxidase maturation factor 2-like isoform X2 [Physella acuta]|nr:dual oxidase maturation factor 2-like isoform X2 [Physella acuta]XP_059143803.1 dual oxidase maturation factor 2-like isoform X2 [Physella acuta]XP_059143812.1 dual oxidase maturation factor 2-like isoform X2 [Physella acuta]
MTWFREFRNGYGFMSYPDTRTAVSFDIPLLAVTYCCVLVAIATLIATLGIRGRERWSAAIRASYSVAIGSILLVCLYGHCWQYGEVEIKTNYVYRNSKPFEGYVGITVGLSSANVTLDGYYEGQVDEGYVYYAESMPWADYGKEYQRFGYFLKRGLPAPILKVMEFLTVDEGDFRWGRSFHTAGQYASALLWTAFAFWIVTNVLLFSVIVYGAYMCFLTGAAMILACVTYHTCQTRLPLVVCFEDENLIMVYGWCFWLTLASGILTSCLGVVLFVMDQCASKTISEFFHLETLDDDDTFEFCEDFRASNPNLLMDRRGSVVPPPNDRRGSIFLEPSRKQSYFNENFQKSLSLGDLTPKSSIKEGSNGVKVNPLFKPEEKAQNLKFDENGEVRIDMECLCEEKEVCLSTKKPSLATLKEHRENHANEKRSTSSSPQKRNGSLPVVTHKGSKVTFKYPEVQGSLAKSLSAGDIFHTVPHHIRELSESSHESLHESSRESSHESSHTLGQETSTKELPYSRQSSVDSSETDSSLGSTDRIKYVGDGSFKGSDVSIEVEINPSTPRS